MDHKSHEEISKELETAKTKITVGADYAHYKNPKKIYRVRGLGTLEATDELCVIYQARYGLSLIFVRPLDEWFERVIWQGKTLHRFTKQ